jgi:hypothetical protein
MDDQHQQSLKRVARLFGACTDPHAREKDGGWSVAQILGHLLDSTSNNHQRLARYVPGGRLDFPGYDQVQFVRRGAYESFPYRDLLSLWTLYNRLLFHLMDHIPTSERGSLIAVGDRPAVTIDELIADYCRHIEIHARQVRRIMGA